MVHAPDIMTSFVLISQFKDKISGFNTAIDMGGGIGRVSKALLTKRFKEVDLLEPAEVQINQAKIDVPEIRKFYNESMQSF